MQPTRYETVGLFVLLATVWGLSFVAAKAALPDVTPVVLAALRFDVAGVLVLCYAAITTTRWYPAERADWYGVVCGGILFVAAHHALLFAGQQYVSSAVAAVVVGLDPILAAGFALVLLPDERRSWLDVLGLCLGLLGVGIVASPGVDDLGSVIGEDGVVGVALVFIAAAAFALGAVLTRRTRTDLPVQSLQAWSMLLGAMVLHAVVLTHPGESLASVTWSTAAVLGLAYLAVVAAGLGYFCYFELLDRVGPVEVNLVAYVAPVFAAVGGWLLLGEAVAVHTVAGFGVIVVGFVLLERRALQFELDRVRRKARER